MEKLLNFAVQTLPDMEDWDCGERHQEVWASFPSYQAPMMQRAAHPVTAKVPPRCDGTTSWFKYSDVVEEWCDLTKVKAKRRGPAIAAHLSGRAEFFKERLDRERFKDPETGVEYLLSTLRPYFVKDGQSVFLYRFFQMLRCNCGQIDFQRWMVRYEIARQKAIENWLDITTPRPDPAVAAVTVEVERLRNAARERLQKQGRHIHRKLSNIGFLNPWFVFAASIEVS